MTFAQAPFGDHISEWKPCNQRQSVTLRTWGEVVIAFGVPLWPLPLDTFEKRNSALGPGGFTPSLSWRQRLGNLSGILQFFGSAAYRGWIFIAHSWKFGLEWELLPTVSINRLLPAKRSKLRFNFNNYQRALWPSQLPSPKGPAFLCHYTWGQVSKWGAQTACPSSRPLALGKHVFPCLMHSLCRNWRYDRRGGHRRVQCRSDAVSSSGRRSQDLEMCGSDFMQNDLAAPTRSLFSPSPSSNYCSISGPLICFVAAVQSLGHVWLFATPWTGALQASLSITNSWSVLKFMSQSKESACGAGDLGSTPGLRRAPGAGNGNLLQYSCLGNPRDRGAGRATVRGVTKSGTWLSN